ncbi:MAG: hypothetical protein JW929_03520 [Anaerolineales bacterium]|nr:hypothetical protein [Anaerolineales bacterium]
MPSGPHAGPIPAGGQIHFNDKAFLLSLLILFFGVGSVQMDWNPPNRPPSGSSCSRTCCFYTASGTWGGQPYGCYLSTGNGSGCLPAGNYVSYFNPSACDGWPVDCATMGCSISGPAGCSGPSDPCCFCSTTYYPPASVSGPGYSCAVPGNAGWCRGGGLLHVTAQEPMDPYVITGIEADVGMLCGGLSGDDVECYWSFPEGVSSFNYWANSSYGDSSAQDSAAMNVDSGQPLLIDSFTPGVPGNNGWYRGGPVTLTCTADDLISGLDALTFSGGTPIPGGVTVDSEGAHTLACTATDIAGNAATVQRPANIDSVPPDLSILYNGNPDPGGWGGSVHITAAATDATSGIYQYGFRVNGGPLETDLILGDGYYEIEGYAEDTAGNITTTHAIVGVDTTPPATSWITASSDWVRGTVTLRGQTADEGSGVAAVYISINGGEKIRVGSDPEWAFTWETGQGRYPDGMYVIEAWAVDAAGNEEHTAILSIGVDNTEPVVAMDEEWTAPSAGGADGYDLTSGVARARVTISGGGMTPWVRDYPSVPGSIDWDGRDGDGNLVPDGDYEVTLEVWDRAGNSSVTGGVIHRPAPAAEVAPTQVAAVPAEPAQIPNNPPVVKTEPPRTVELPKGLPFWSLVLPLAALGVWLAASNAALARDRRFVELRGIRLTLARYRNQTKTNFMQEGDDD